MSQRPPRERERGSPGKAAPALPPADAAPLPDRPRRRPWFLVLSVVALVAWFAALLWLAWR